VIDAVGNVPEDTLKRLNILFGTPKGSVPLDRDFGLDHGFVDMPMNVARIKMMESCIIAVRRYEPEYMVRDMHFSPGSGEDGRYNIKVVVDYAD